MCASVEFVKWHTFDKRTVGVRTLIVVQYSRGRRQPVAPAMTNELSSHDFPYTHLVQLSAVPIRLSSIRLGILV